MEKAKYMKFLETSRDGGVVYDIVIDAIKYYIGSYTGDVDWEDVEESLGAYSSGWLTYAQDTIEFYAKNHKEVDGIVSQNDAFQSIWEEMQKSNAPSVIEAIHAACYRAYDIVLSDIVNQLKQLEE